METIEKIENEQSKDIIYFFNLRMPPKTLYSIAANFDGAEWFYGESEKECLENYELLKKQNSYEVEYFLDSLIVKKTVYPDFKNDKKYIDVLYDCMSKLDQQLETFRPGKALENYIDTPRYYTFKEMQESIFDLVIDGISQYNKGEKWKK